VNKLIGKAIFPSSLRRGGRDIKKMMRSDIFLLAQPPLLTEEGIVRLIHILPRFVHRFYDRAFYCVGQEGCSNKMHILHAAKINRAVIA